MGTADGDRVSGDGSGDPRESVRDDSEAYRIRMAIAPEGMRAELVSAFAGDREMTDAERAFVRERMEGRGSVFYSDLFYAISHHYFAPDIAEALWNKVLLHKHLISERLGRNVRMTVATLDYFSNITRELRTPTLISEDYASEISNLSMRDGMTGLFNHSSCYELLELEFRSHRRHGRGLALIMSDIDDFKAVNDRHGHQEGDRVLIEVARKLSEEVRESDICCRFGGEEFIAILPFTSDPDEACGIAERIRAKAKEIAVGEQRITISAGVAVCGAGTPTPGSLIESADKALYRAKQDGKDRIVLWGAP